MDNLTSIISRVQKLLALSKSDNANESANAAAAANKLIDEYRLSIDDINQDLNDPIIEDDSYIYESGKITPWKASLVLNLAKHYGIAVFNDCDFSSGRKVSRYRMVGRKSDLEIAKHMIVWLSLQCVRLSEREAKGKGRVFVSSYCNGFVAGVIIQLNKSRQEIIQSNETSMVKLNSKLEKANEFMRKMHNLKSHVAKSASRIDANAFGAGKEKGSNIHLGQSLPSKNSLMLNK